MKKKEILKLLNLDLGDCLEEYEFTQNKDCQFFPCHDVEDKESFNCKFCYCPLYFLEECPGNYKILDNGIKDCSYCKFPHYADMKEVVGEYMDKYVEEGKWKND